MSRFSFASLAFFGAAASFLAVSFAAASVLASFGASADAAAAAEEDSVPDPDFEYDSEEVFYC